MREKEISHPDRFDHGLLQTSSAAQRTFLWPAQAIQATLPVRWLQRREVRMGLNWKPATASADARSGEVAEGVRMKIVPRERSMSDWYGTCRCASRFRGAMPVTSCCQSGHQDGAARNPRCKFPVVSTSLRAAHFPASCTFTLSPLCAGESRESGCGRNCATCAAQAAESNASKSISTLPFPCKPLGAQLQTGDGRHSAGKVCRRSMYRGWFISELFLNSQVAMNQHPAVRGKEIDRKGMGGIC